MTPTSYPTVKELIASIQQYMRIGVDYILMGGIRVSPGMSDNLPNGNKRLDQWLVHLVYHVLPLVTVYYVLQCPNHYAPLKWR
uniref:Uncharacterized protein n=1 Tax=viral metagenome TaxID=1070528 RepID=A0A6M3JS23_9ZZZZ